MGVCLAAVAACSTSPTPAPAPSSREVALGVFRGTEIPRVRAFGEWLGRQPDYVLDFPETGSWETILRSTREKGDYWRGSGYRLVYSVPLLPDEAAPTMAKGADGTYDDRFTDIAQALVETGQSNAVIRLGWEFNIKNSRWKTDVPAEFIAFWQHVVSAMRAVPGNRFEFDWNPTNGYTAFSGEKYWPGGDYVDYVGIDVYDISWRNGSYPYPKGCDDDACRLPRQQLAWDEIYNGERGLGFWTEFAADHGKPVSLPEWAMWTRTEDYNSGDDDPYFIDQMADYIENPAHNVAYQIYFDFLADNGPHRLQEDFPRGGARYRERFGQP
ncbi:hypothetical protein ACIB24_20980 [Spongisporangium articulatum]|uniref:GH26 domain-containing protein n=1 Tax=Spongisporangium articulatum TaxID=3362603 RepID=A0ABW8ATY7_9ACTN